MWSISLRLKANVSKCAVVVFSMNQIITATATRQEQSGKGLSPEGACPPSLLKLRG